MHKLKQQPLTVKDIFAKIFQGIATSGDKVYLIKGKENGNYIEGYSQQLDKIVTIEKGLVKPMLKGEDISKYKNLENQYWVIFPYLINNGKAEPMTENYIDENFPKGYDYLKENEDFLRGRINESFLTKQILDIVPNPWIGMMIGQKVIKLFTEKYDKETVSSNFVFIIEELKKLLEKERDLAAEKVFKELVKNKKLHFFLITDKGGFKIPPRIKVRSNKQLIRDDNTPIQRSLFDVVPEENINELEKSVAIYLD